MGELVELVYYVVAVGLAGFSGWTLGVQRERRTRNQLGGTSRGTVVLEQPVAAPTVPQEPPGLFAERWTLFTREMEPLEGLEGETHEERVQIKAHTAPKWDRKHGGFR